MVIISIVGLLGLLGEGGNVVRCFWSILLEKRVWRMMWSKKNLYVGWIDREDIRNVKDVIDCIIVLKEELIGYGKLGW